MRGGASPLTPKQRQALDVGRVEWAAERRRRKAAGMNAAREWNQQRRPVPAKGHMPFEGHRTCAEVDRDERVDKLEREMRS
jgi:hypothetical protein